ncbi:hypothetical protein DPMN_079724 [Dreissena polymorpha]|uniref:Uncharacterized protein n=1 Tax=Dreissena polymorpha TaxID=45954 RepID=A0A9D3YT40_DREPO|nr:hypothetical protein DPMN_079724 [Dreissena polymorpha]
MERFRADATVFRRVTSKSMSRGCSTKPGNGPDAFQVGTGIGWGERTSEHVFSNTTKQMINMNMQRPDE